MKKRDMTKLPDHWPPTQKAHFERMYDYWRKNQELIVHPRAARIAPTYWDTIAWNAAWMHAEPPPMDQKMEVITPTKAGVKIQEEQ